MHMGGKPNNGLTSGFASYDPKMEREDGVGAGRRGRSSDSEAERWRLLSWFARSLDGDVYNAVKHGLGVYPR
jgi:hypothetical protein